MNLNNHLADSDSSAKPFHSSGFARVGSEGRIGSVSPISFDRRQQIENNRRVIMSYNRSAIANNHTLVARSRPVTDFRSGDTASGNVSAAPIRTAPQLPRKFNRFG